MAHIFRFCIRKFKLSLQHHAQFKHKQNIFVQFTFPFRWMKIPFFSSGELEIMLLAAPAGKNQRFSSCWMRLYLCTRYDSSHELISHTLSFQLIKSMSVFYWHKTTRIARNCFRPRHHFTFSSLDTNKSHHQNWNIVGFHPFSLDYWAEVNANTKNIVHDIMVHNIGGLRE